MDIIHIMENTLETLMIQLCTPNKDFEARDKISGNDEFYNTWYEKTFNLINAITNNIPCFECYLPENYDEFLLTPYWKIVSHWVKQKYGYSCAMCDSKKVLQAHHRTYKRHFHEHEFWEEDLVCLCQECHQRFNETSKLYEKR